MGAVVECPFFVKRLLWCTRSLKICGNVKLSFDGENVHIYLLPKDKNSFASLFNHNNLFDKIVGCSTNLECHEEESCDVISRQCIHVQCDPMLLKGLKGHLVSKDKKNNFAIGDETIFR